MENDKILEISSGQLEKLSPQIKRFISFVNGLKKPTSEQLEDFNEKATQFIKELNKINETVKQIKQDKDSENQNPKLESMKSQLLVKISTLTDKLSKLDKKIGVIDGNSLSANESITRRDSKSQDPESTLPTSDTTDINLNEDKVGGSSKKDKGKKSKGEMKSAEVKKTKTKAVNDVKDGVTVVAQVHAVEDVNESNEDIDNHDCVDNNNNNDAKDDGKTSGKLRSPKRLLKSGKKAKTPKDENEASLKKSKKTSKKKEKATNGKSNKVKKANDEKLLIEKPSSKQGNNAEDIETIEELEDEEGREDESEADRVEPFQKDTSEVNEKTDTKEIIISQNSSQVNTEKVNQMTEAVPPIQPNKEAAIEFYRTFRQWAGEDEDDLSFNSGETLRIIEKDDDGWWLGENIQGQQGLVPMNFLKKIDLTESEWQKMKSEYEKSGKMQAEDSPQTYSDADDEQVNEGELEERKEIKVLQTKNSTNQPTVRTEDITKHDDDDDDDTWGNEVDNGQEDEFEDTYSVEEEVDDVEDNDEYNESGEDKVKTVLNDTSKSCTVAQFSTFQSEKDISSWYIKNNEKAVKSYQPLPSGVRLSFLSLPGLNSFNYQKFLSPKLGSSHLVFTDILLDVDGKKITRRQPRWQKILTIQKISQLSLLEESNLSILNCLIRLCLFDGVKPISNICYLPITPTDREKKTWIVTPHNIRKSEKAYELSSDLFIRYNEFNMNVCLLIEVGILVTKQNANQPIELSLGWITVPLYDENGQIMPNKNYEYPLQESLPFETKNADKGSVKDGSLKSRVQNLLFNRTTQMTIRFSQPNKEQQDKLDALPDVLIGLLGYTPFLSYHRDFLANVFPGYRGSSEKDRLILRHVPPEVAVFPVIADCPLLIECLRVSWQDRLKEIPANKKKDTEYLRKIYSDHFRRVIYPFLWLQDVHFSNVMSAQQFENDAAKTLLLLDQIRQDIIAFVTSNKYKFKLITSKEFTCPIQFAS
ncbi:unnamed protein product [Trichobilharzia szidati]|nr:unnamed protein product [Trichobilharzia szidati]